MNKSLNLASKIVAGFFVIALFLSNSADPPNGRTGAPGDGVCTSCHGGNNFEGHINILDLPSTVVSGQRYKMTVAVTNTDAKAVRAGFQLVSLFDEDFKNAGDYISQSSDSDVSKIGDRQYLEHRGPKNFEDNVATWIFDWVAPDVDEDTEITMYAAGNIANGGASSGDAIKFKEEKIKVQAASSTCDFSLNLNVNQISCFGANDGEVTIDPEGFQQPLKFEWSNGEKLFIAMAALSAGKYDITVTDGSGCSIVEAFEIVEPDLLEVSLRSKFENCDDLTMNSLVADVRGGTGKYTYKWNNGSSDEVLQNVTVGNYSVTITDESGCVAMDQYVFELKDKEPPVISFTDSVDLYIGADGTLDFTPLNLNETDNCGVASVLLSGNKSCNELSARNLNYKVTDVNGNVADASVYINGIIDTFPPTSPCREDIIQDGCSPVDYALPDFIDNCGIDTVLLIEGLASGAQFPKDSTKVTYEFYDFSGNSGTCTFYVVTNNNLMLEIDEVQDASANNGGSIMITAGGGTGVFNYEWIMNDTMVVSSFEDVSNLDPGSYVVKVTDGSGCVIHSEPITIELGSSTHDAAIQEVEIYPNPVNSVLYLEYTGTLMKANIVGFNGQFLNAVETGFASKTISINLESYASGIYFIQLFFDSEMQTLKFVKQ
ncbi:choice-of-anchor V domain-containing protein [Portibacter lacus]|uniref:HYR domain-containing protein n=1 Tax=Portibacter lacus TaxID=1099794 RepID=A0AA37WGR5_9BACT|nr:choice-of-anchor V domain-containing protein [Portibacter lacus]GLR20128.1 hypothetical protein GCM10007940_47440 [Portibacter lacus]